MPKNSKGIEVAEVLFDKCIGCQICVAECPVGAIEISDGVALIDPEICIGCGKCFEVCPVEAIKFEKKKRVKRIRKPEEVSEGVPAGYQGIAVFIESSDDHGATVSWEMVGKAKELAEKLNTKVIGFFLGHEVDSIVQEAMDYGCDDIHVIDDPFLKTYLSKPYGKALTDLCKKVKPEIFLIGATPIGRDLSSIVATNLETGLTADCTGLDIEEEKNLLLMTRPTFGGNIMATIFCEHHRPQMSTVRPRVFKEPEKVSSRTGNIYRHDFEPPHEKPPELITFIKDVVNGGVDITPVPGPGCCR